MTIIQMLYFNTVCEYMNLTKSAEKLHVSQPALSSVIKQMETECGVELFHHRANSISVTDEGLVLREEIRPILEQYTHLERLLKTHKLDRNYVRIGLSPLYGNSVMPHIISTFREQYPDIQVLITEAGTSFLYENLDLDKFDLILAGGKPGFSWEDWEQSPLYEYIRLKTVEPVFAVNADNPLAKKQSVTWEDITGEYLILLDRSYDQKRNLTQALEADGRHLPENVYYSTQVHTIVQFVEKNAAAGFLPKDLVQDNPLIRGLPFPGSRPEPLYLVWRRDRHQYHAARTFINTARETFPDGQTEDQDL